MKKIFIPAITLLLTGWAVSSQAQYTETYANPAYPSRCGLQGCPEEEPPLFEDIFDKPGNESYWKNRFRTYRVYPIVMYPEYTSCDDVGMASAQTVNAHEYQRGVVVSANRGQRMYDSTTYTLTTHTISGEAYRFNTKGVISSKTHDFKIHTDDLFRPFGEVSINEESFMLLRIDNTAYTLLIDEKGKIYDKLGVARGGKLYIGNDTIVYNPKYMKLIRADSMSQSASGNQLNFDIRYDGIENGMLSFLVYDAASGTTTKRTVYPAQRFVNINGVNFEIIYYTPEYIEYRLY